MRRPTNFELLEWFVRSDYFAIWQESNTSSMGVENPERLERCYEASEHGAEGSTHSEVIDDWRQAADAYGSDSGHTRVAAAIEKEADLTEIWHKNNGSLYEQIG